MPELDSSRKLAFEAIHDGHDWGGGSRSGPGSDPNNTAIYLDYLHRWLALHPGCRNIVEIGCGDWATSRLLSLTPEQTYTGYDIVPAIIARNTALYQSERVHFICADFLEELPKGGDLLIVKDVLQHLSNASVAFFIRKILPRYRYAVIVNDVRKLEERTLLGLPLGRREIQAPNIDVPDGGSRPLQLEVAPFWLPVSERISYQVILRHKPPRIIYIKDVLVWVR